MVEQNAIIVNGIPCDSRGIPLLRKDLYVHPVTKVLCKVEKKSYKARAKKEKPIKRVNGNCYLKCNEVWFKVESRPWKATSQGQYDTDIFHGMIHKYAAWSIYGEYVVVTKKGKQLNTKEIKQLGLKSENTK